MEEQRSREAAEAETARLTQELEQAHADQGRLVEVEGAHL